LAAAAGGSAAAGMNLKSIDGWSLGSRGMDAHGFSALPGGNRGADGKFDVVNGGGYWWTGTPGPDGGSAYYRYMYHDLSGVGELSGGDGQGFSVRCVRK
jgi:uncharacterized protein (TIGR02145 family)